MWLSSNVVFIQVVYVCITTAAKVTEKCTTKKCCEVTNSSLGVELNLGWGKMWTIWTWGMLWECLAIAVTAVVVAVRAHLRIFYNCSVTPIQRMVLHTTATRP